MKDVRSGMTPLMIASKHGHLEIVDYLIENGADLTSVDNPNRHDRNALHINLLPCVE
jgi:ankyrin repeat protein